MTVKSTLKRGALLVAANWPTVAIQFAARTTFQALVAVPIVSGAIVVAILLGEDARDLISGGLREIPERVSSALAVEPLALTAFAAALAVVVLAGSLFMFLVKGGTVSVLLSAEETGGAIERGPVGFERLREASAFTPSRFSTGCRRLFRRYVTLGLLLMAVYAVSLGAYVLLVAHGYRTLDNRALVAGWTFLAAVGAVLLVAWVTAVNLLYLLLQIAVAVDDSSVGSAFSRVARFARAEPRRLGGVFVVVFAMLAGATLVSALAWSAVALVAFVPLIGVVVIPLQLAGLILRGLVFEYIGLTGLGAYLALYRGHAIAEARTASRGAVGAAGTLGATS